MIGIAVEISDTHPLTRCSSSALMIDYVLNVAVGISAGSRSSFHKW